MDRLTKIREKAEKVLSAKYCDAAVEAPLKIIRDDIPYLLTQLAEKEKERQAWQDDFNHLNAGGLKRITELEARLAEAQRREQAAIGEKNILMAELNNHIDLLDRIEKLEYDLLKSKQENAQLRAAWGLLGAVAKEDTDGQATP